MQDYKSFCLNKPVRGFKKASRCSKDWDEPNIESEPNVLILYFSKTEYIKLLAQAECCSTSYFEYNVTELEKSLASKSITSIDFEKSNDESSEEKRHVIRIALSDGNDYKFGLINRSNGYYDGWLEIELSKTVSTM
jgi:hypothetical protein